MNTRSKSEKSNMDKQLSQLSTKSSASFDFHLDDDNSNDSNDTLLKEILTKKLDGITHSASAHDLTQTDESDNDEMTTLLTNKDKQIEKKNDIIAALQKENDDLKKNLGTTKSAYEILENEKAILLQTAIKDFEFIRKTAVCNINMITDAGVHLQDITNVEERNNNEVDVVIPLKEEKRTKRKSETFENEAENQLSEVQEENKCSKKKKLPIEFYPTDYIILPGQLANMDKSSISTYARDLVGVLFSQEELATHSVTGRQSNANKHLQVRPQLDKNRLNAAKNEVLKKFGKSKNFESLFNYGARNKCGYHKQKLKTKQ